MSSLLVCGSGGRLPLVGDRLGGEDSAMESREREKVDVDALEVYGDASGE